MSTCALSDDAFRSRPKSYSTVVCFSRLEIIGVIIEALLQPVRTQAVVVDTVVFVGDAASVLSASGLGADYHVVMQHEKLTVVSKSKTATRPNPTATIEAEVKNLSRFDTGRIAEFGISTGLFDPSRTCFVWLDHLPSSERPSFPKSSSFAGVLVLFNESAGRPADFWHWTKDLFDAGYVACRETRAESYWVAAHIRSDAVMDMNAIGGHKRGQIAMSTLGKNGRFANQLFQYAFVYFYGLRHGLEILTPEWEGTELFGLYDRWNADHELARLQFFAFDDDDLSLWDIDDPPIDFDAWGYFQEMPNCWKQHRDLLRKRLRLTHKSVNPLEAWHLNITNGGRRPLIGIHVRRGDYLTLHTQGLPWYRPVPEAWYLQWLEEIWPTLKEPVLYIATDAPKDVIPKFDKYSPISLESVPAEILLPGHVTDFEVLRRANFLAIANSSFSRMAGILGRNTETCVLPDFGLERLVPYEPWIDSNFWSKFTEGSHKDKHFGNDLAAVRLRSVGVRIELMAARKFIEYNKKIENSVDAQLTAARKIIDYYKEVEERLTELLDYRDRTLSERDNRILSIALENDNLSRQLSELSINSERQLSEFSANAERQLIATRQQLESTQKQIYWNSVAGWMRRILFRIVLIVILIVENSIGRFSKKIKLYCQRLRELIAARQYRTCVNTILATLKMRPI
jgi:hypothetical protein